jgi:4-amino-4-deoxy-L-arabinose transferase-like glycosyltransferase
MLKKSHLVLTVVLLLAAFLSGMQVLELRAEEPRRAVVAMEMYLGGDYIVPHLHGWVYYNKPPFFNWLMALCFWLTGSSHEWVVRLPGLVSFWATAVLLFLVVRRQLGQQVGIFASLFFLTGADLLFYGSVNTGEIDLFFGLLVFLQAWVVFHFSRKGDYLAMFVSAYGLTAVAFLTKGMPALVFQAITLLAWLGWMRRLRLLLSWQHLAGVGCFVLPLAIYFLAYAKQAAPLPYLVNLLKDATQRSALEGSMATILLNLLRFPLNLVAVLLPWSLLAWFALRRDIWTQMRREPLLEFMVVYTMANIAVYWLSPDVRNRYVYPFFPFLTTMLAWAVLRFSSWRPSWLLTGVVLMALLRLVYNFAGMPWQQSHGVQTGLVYRQLSSEILGITGSAPVHLAGEPYLQTADPSLGPFPFRKIELTLPPMVPYQIPYYLTRSNGHVVRYDRELRPGTYYLAFRDFAERQNVSPLFVFEERWSNQPMVLFRAE